MPPSLFWVTEGGVVFQLYRIYHLYEDELRDVWVALKVGRSAGLVFANESYADAQPTWERAVGNLKPLGNAIKITIVGPGWTGGETEGPAAQSNEEIERRLLSVHQALEVRWVGDGLLDAVVTNPAYCLGRNFWSTVLDLGLEIMHVAKTGVGGLTAHLRKKETIDE